MSLTEEGILEDQGRDPLTFFRAHGIAPGDVLARLVAAGTPVTWDAKDRAVLLRDGITARRQGRQS